MKPIVIGLSGLSGAGKTFYINHLKNKLGHDLALISLDDYYIPHEEQQKDENGVPNYDLPTALHSDLFKEHLQDLIDGKAVKKIQYQFELENPEERILHINPAKVIMAEGLFVFEYKPVFDLLDIKIFLTCDEELCLERRLKRDTEERGIPAERSQYQWANHVMPAYKKYILPYKNDCDAVYHNQGEPHDNLDKMMELVNNYKSE
jgi:uridine kinase